MHWHKHRRCVDIAAWWPSMIIGRHLPGRPRRLVETIAIAATPFVGTRLPMLAPSLCSPLELDCNVMCDFPQLLFARATSVKVNDPSLQICILQPKYGLDFEAARRAHFLADELSYARLRLIHHERVLPAGFAIRQRMPGAIEAPLPPACVGVALRAAVRIRM